MKALALALLAALLAAGCTAPPATLPDTPGAPPPAAPPPPAPDPKPSAPHPAPPPEGGSANWSGEVTLATPTGASVTSDPHRLVLTHDATLVVTLAPRDGVGVGPLRIAVQAAVDADPVLEGAGPGSFRVEGPVPAGTWLVFVTGTAGSIAAGRAYEATAAWVP